MRTENEMYDLILEVAKNDARIKAVYMNGSRTNENVPKDNIVIGTVKIIAQILTAKVPAR